MAIQISANAAAISWLALSQALDSRAIMEGALLNMYKDSTTMSINEAKSQADNALEAQKDAAKQTEIQGIQGIAGAAASCGTTFLSIGMEARNNRLASDCGQTTEQEIEMKELKKNLGTTKPVNGSAQITAENTDTITDYETPEWADSSSATSSSSAKVSASNKGSVSSTGSANETEQSKDNQAADTSAKQKQYIRNMEFWVQNSSQFASMADSVVKGFGSLSQTGFFGAGKNYIVDQGQAQAAQALAQGLSNLFNNQTSMLASALSSCDSYMQNTNGTISAMIQASSARG